MQGVDVVRHGLTFDQRQTLLDIGNGVCRIERTTENGTEQLGTGFHFGGGWIMTNEHVISGAEPGAWAEQARFIFPKLPIEPAKRHVIVANFNDPGETQAQDDSGKDLALIYVEALAHIQNDMVHTLNAMPKIEAAAHQRVYLIHYGSGIHCEQNEPNPQQYSVTESKVLMSFENKHGNKMSVHTAHSRPCASGAPLIAFDENSNTFMLCGVNFAGQYPDMIIDSPGYALLFHGDHWLQSTIAIASDLASRRLYMYNGADAEQARICQSLDEKLQHDRLRVIVAEKPPPALAGITYANIRFMPLTENGT